MLPAGLADSRVQSGPSVVPLGPDRQRATRPILSALVQGVASSDQPGGMTLKRLATATALALAISVTAAVPASAIWEDARLDWMKGYLTVKTTSVYVGDAVQEVVVERFRIPLRPNAVRLSIASHCTVRISLRKGARVWAYQASGAPGWDSRPTTVVFPKSVRPPSQAIINTICDPGW